MLKAVSLVFTPPEGPVDLRAWRQWWQFRFGAFWRCPYRPGSSLDGLEEVVHIAYRDAEAYAHWAGKELPTEAEWEPVGATRVEGKLSRTRTQSSIAGRTAASSFLRLTDEASHRRAYQVRK